MIRVGRISDRWRSVLTWRDTHARSLADVHAIRPP